MGLILVQSNLVRMIFKWHCKVESVR